MNQEIDYIMQVEKTRYLMYDIQVNVDYYNPILIKKEKRKHDEF